jgi:hypothetical protein
MMRWRCILTGISSRSQSDYARETEIRGPGSAEFSRRGDLEEGRELWLNR